MPTTYGNDIVYCLKSHCGVRGYCRQKWVLQVQIICKFSNAALQKKMRAEKQFSRQLEMNSYLRTLKQQIDAIKQQMTQRER